MSLNTSSTPVCSPFHPNTHTHSPVGTWRLVFLQGSLPLIWFGFSHTGTDRWTPCSSWNFSRSLPLLVPAVVFPGFIGSRRESPLQSVVAIAVTSFLQVFHCGSPWSHSPQLSHPHYDYKLIATQGSSWTHLNVRVRVSFCPSFLAYTHIWRPKVPGRSAPNWEPAVFPQVSKCVCVEVQYV